MIPILTYHRVADISGNSECVTTDTFYRQMKYLQQNGYAVISNDYYCLCLDGQARLPKRAVMITFDDGYEDNLLNAAPILAEFGYSAIVFVIADYIGKLNDWESFPGKITSKTMDSAQLKAWLDCGLQIGSHTLSHYNLRDISQSAKRQEIFASRYKINDIISQATRGNEYNCSALCYPYGEFDEYCRQLAIEAGYDIAYAVYRRTKPWTNDRWAVPRWFVRDWPDMKEFAYRLSWRYRVAATINLGLRKLRKVN